MPAESAGCTEAPNLFSTRSKGAPHLSMGRSRLSKKLPAQLFALCFDWPEQAFAALAASFFRCFFLLALALMWVPLICCFYRWEGVVLRVTSQIPARTSSEPNSDRGEMGSCRKMTPTNIAQIVIMLPRLEIVTTGRDDAA